MASSVFDIFGEQEQEQKTLQPARSHSHSHSHAHSAGARKPGRRADTKNKKSFLHNMDRVSSIQMQGGGGAGAGGQYRASRVLRVYEDQPETDTDTLHADELAYSSPPSHYQDDDYLSDGGGDAVSASFMDKYVFGLPDHDDRPLPYSDTAQMSAPSSPTFTVYDRDDDSVEEPIFDIRDDDDFKLLDF